MQVLVGFALVVPLAGAAAAVLRWVVKARSPIPGLVSLGVVMVAALSMVGYEYDILSSRGEEVDAVVARRTRNAGTHRNGPKYSCTLREVGGGEIEPNGRTADCRHLRRGDEVRVLVDPEGEIRPLLVDGLDRGLLGGDSDLARIARPAVMLLGVALGGLILLGGVKSRYRLPPPPGPPSA